MEYSDGPLIQLEQISAVIQTNIYVKIYDVQCTSVVTLLPNVEQLFQLYSRNIQGLRPGAEKNKLC